MALKDKPLEMSEVEIQDWEAKDVSKRKVQIIKFPKGDGTDLKDLDIFYAVAADRVTSTACADMGRNADISVAKINDVLINSCLLAGDVELLKIDDSLYYGLLGEISKLGDVKKRV